MNPSCSFTFVKVTFPNCIYYLHIQGSYTYWNCKYFLSELMRICSRNTTLITVKENICSLLRSCSCVTTSDKRILLVSLLLPKGSRTSSRWLLHPQQMEARIFNPRKAVRPLKFPILLRSVMDALPEFLIVQCAVMGGVNPNILINPWGDVYLEKEWWNELRNTKTRFPISLRDD